jgi:hypothetical protein
MTTANVISSVFISKSKKNIKNLEREFVTTSVVLNFLFLFCKLPYAIGSTFISISYLNIQKFTFFTGDLSGFQRSLAHVLFYLKIVKLSFPIYEIIFYIVFNKSYRQTSLDVIRKMLCLDVRRKGTVNKPI